MSDFEVRMYHGSRLVYEGLLDGPIEIGRQRKAGEPLFEIQSIDGEYQVSGRRIAVAALDEITISRKHVWLEPLSTDRVRVTNKSTINEVLNLGGGDALPAQACGVLPVPFGLRIGDCEIRVDRRHVRKDEVQSLASPRPLMDDSSNSSAVLQALPDDDSESLVAWLQALTAVLQSAASSADFFERAAKALVELVGLDSGRVLLREGNSWETKCCQLAKQIGPHHDWQPSARMLEGVLSEKRTYWSSPERPDAVRDSLLAIQAVVVAPIFGNAGELIGALYGDRLKSGPLGDRPKISKSEAMLVELLASGVAAGLARLEQERAAVSAQVRFEQFFSPGLARLLAAESDLLNGRDAEVTVMFCDVRGFSRTSERIGHAAAAPWLRTILGMMSDCVVAHEGVLVDYMGDELMAMWGAPANQPDHAARACRAAIDIARALPELSNSWRERVGGSTRVCVGINTGIARVGDIGSDRKFKYGPLGNTVNLASRVQGVTKFLKAEMLLTAATHDKLGSALPTRRLCTARVVNIAGPVDLFELRTGDDPGWPGLCHAYEEALTEFERRNFQHAAKILGGILAEHQHDGPSLVLLSRAVNAMVDGAPAPNHVWELERK